MPTIYLWHVRTAESVPAELRPLALVDLDAIEQDWKPLLATTREGDAHWDWRLKEAILGLRPDYESYVIACAGPVQGAMMIRVAGMRSRVEPDAGLIYVEFVAAAPWNRRTIQDPPEYRRVGSALLSFAVTRSLELGYAGRVGLHSLPGAEAFYERLGLTRFEPDPGHQGLVYFEWLADAAQQWYAAYGGEANE